VFTTSLNRIDREMTEIADTSPVVVLSASQLSRTDRGRRTTSVDTAYPASEGSGSAVVAYQGGDKLAIGLLMAQFERPMQCVARRFLSCPDDVNDAVQDAWVAFVRSAEGIVAPMAIGGWLCVTTARAAVTIARRQARCRPTGAILETRTAEGEPDDRDTDGASLRAVREAVEHLDPKDRELIDLLFGTGLTYAEITAVTGRALGGIGPTRKRVIDKLRRDRAIVRLVAARAA
jgi:RNA polymerase sigma factor (sigma-70 family)